MTRNSSSNDLYATVDKTPKREPVAQNTSNGAIKAISTTAPNEQLYFQIQSDRSDDSDALYSRLRDNQVDGDPSAGYDNVRSGSESDADQFYCRIDANRPKAKSHPPDPTANLAAANAKKSAGRQARAKTEPPHSENVHVDPLYSKIDDGSSDVGYAHVKRRNGDLRRNGEEEEIYDPMYNHLNELGDRVLKRDRPFSSFGDRKVSTGEGVKRAASDSSAGLYAAITKDRAVSPRSHVHIEGSEAAPSTSSAATPPNIPSKNFIVSDNISIPIDETDAEIDPTISEQALHGGMNQQHEAAVRGNENGINRILMLIAGGGRERRGVLVEESMDLLFNLLNF